MEISTDTLHTRKKVWETKTLLRRVYGRWYYAIQKNLRLGRTLELGGGSGHLREFLSEAIITDVLPVPWLDAVADAQELPFGRETFDNIVLVDVLHHLPSAYCFFSEARRVLKPQGRILIIEPYVSFFSFFVYRFFHPESVDWHANLLPKHKINGKSRSLPGNLAFSNLLFGRFRHMFEIQFSALRILKEEKTDVLVYPLSGGFQEVCFLPPILFPILERMEELLRLFIATWHFGSS
jgi:SAM-dependent methyltransferase